MLFGLPGLLLCLFAVGAQASVQQAPAPQPDASGVYTYTFGGEVESPRVKKEVRPQYTADALKRRIEGVVWIEVVVMPNGKVGEAAVIRSLDKVFGLDQEALKAARKWRFAPGRARGKPVPVRVAIEMTFTAK